MNPAPQLVGYEISPQAFALATSRSAEGLEFRLGDVLHDAGTFDLMLLIDVIEHLEDYFGLLRRLQSRAEHKLFHIPLELSAQSVLLDYPLEISRENLGHLHFFTRETALGMLRGLGYEVVGWMYTPSSSLLRYDSWKLRALERTRRMLFPISPTATVRLMGGYSLMVLSR
jgi:hypothetical protein